MEILTKEEWYKLKRESCKVRNAQKKKTKSPTQQHEFSLKWVHSRLSENAPRAFSKSDTFLAWVRYSHLSENASGKLDLFYVLSFSPSARHMKPLNPRKLG